MALGNSRARVPAHNCICIILETRELRDWRDTLGYQIKQKIKGFTHKIRALTQVFKKLLFPFICLLVWNFTKSKSENKRKETVRFVSIIVYVIF